MNRLELGRNNTMENGAGEGARTVLQVDLVERAMNYTS
jgi:hypothetical protein